MTNIKYPVYKPSLKGNEKKYINECIDSTWISSKGKFVKEFESKFSEFTGIKHSATVSNGTVALHLALEALGICSDDEVIVPTLTYIASVNAITYTGAKAIFVDSLLDTWQMDPKDVERKITSKTKAIICVHLYGQACEMDSLLEICKKHNLYLIEDCAEAIGSKYKNKHVGTFGNVATFSFYGNKTITTGEGGMVSTNDKTLYDRLVNLKGQGLAKYREYWHDSIGYNYRMTNICAAIGVAQLEQIDKTLNKKREIADWYRQGLKNTYFSFHSEAKDTKHSYWMFTILLPESIDRNELKEYLMKNGIETRPMFYPIHTMPVYSHKYEKHQNAEFLARKGMNLPSYPELTKPDIEHIINCLTRFQNEKSKS